MANFLTGNVIYDPADRNRVKWCVNLDSLINNIENIIGFNNDNELQPYTGPSLFINGKLSVDRL